MKKFVLPYEGDKRIKRAIAIIIIITVGLTYGGIDAFILTFLMFPFVRRFAKDLDIPRRLMPAMLVVSGMTMGAPGAPQFNNLLATGLLHLPPTAGLIPGLIGVVIGEIGVYFVVTRSVLKAKAAGEHYEDGPLPPMPEEQQGNLPNFWVCLIPPALVILLYTILNLSIVIALTAAILATIIFMGKYIKRESLFHNGRPSLYGSIIRSVNLGSESFPNPIISINTPGGFAQVVTSTAAFGAFSAFFSQLPLHPLLVAFIVVCIIVALSSSTTVPVVVCIPLLAGMFLGGEGGVPAVITAGALARVVAMTTTTFESLPQNGMIQLTVCVLSKSSIKESYFPLLLQTVVIPFICVLISTALLILFPALG
jgi:H+/gluconate symporter-like permease